jgi:hypothetical protein
MPRQTVSLKYATALRGEIRRSYADLTKAERETARAKDDVRELKVAKAVLQDELDAMAGKLNKMGTDLGAAHAREIATRQVACVALAAIGTLAHSVKVAPADQVSTTAFALERDGRAQLERAKNGNGAHA